ncbi:MAG TPA: BON domain-containing protein [Burkholderiales bacterium]
MKWSKEGRGALTAVTAGALVVSLSACDQIQSLWKSESPATNASIGQAPKPVEGKIEVAKAAELPKMVEAPKVDEDKLLVGRIKSALGADPALKLLAIDATASEGVVTLYGTADTRARREKAAQVVSSVPGVKSVKNELVIVAGS